MKVIFIDVGGVLNSVHYCRSCNNNQDAFVNPKLVRNLKKIINKTGAKVVLTETYKGVINKSKGYYLKKVFKEYDIEIYDYTLRTGMEKCIDIQEWLNHNRNVTNIVILDDNSDMRHFTEYLVKTKSYTKVPFLWHFTEGLCNKKVKEVIRILEKPFVNKMANQVTNNIRKLF